MGLTPTETLVAAYVPHLSSQACGTLHVKVHGEVRVCFIPESSPAVTASGCDRLVRVTGDASFDPQDVEDLGLCGTQIGEGVARAFTSVSRLGTQSIPRLHVSHPWTHWA